jgi:preprotein translocase subunit SecY
MWLGERIQDKGLGNGTSIIIMVGILSRLPISIVQEFSSKEQRGGGGLLIFLVEIAILVIIIMGLIVLVQGVRKIPVNYAKQIVGNKQLGGARQFLPIKVNSAGVMPIIFAQAIMFLPTLVSFTNLDSTQGIVRIFNDHSNFWYMLIYAVMVIGFTFLYTALIFNPKQIAEDLKKNKEDKVKKMKEEIIIRPIPSNEAEPWLLFRHYARRLCPISFAFGAFINAKLVSDSVLV